ncbi:hypothetical protein GT347_05755 [Xylophilus rhododendri]|uniref:Uncharacterized protein n=1 Tax=Xylophilus rhododendri TaxID=2697032 RepID=A0A857J1F8_9BURK|nr:hypothetical protein [Xylophilus rhododendri]QHI97536.1 hypothetical protein GT347_05755 [Xylophilus rhododendri]
MPADPKTPPEAAAKTPQPPSLNTSVTEDERTEGGPTDESGQPKLDTSNDT